MEENRESVFRDKNVVIWGTVAIAVLVALTIEFVKVFQYDLLRILTFDILQVFLFIITVIDLKHRVIPNKIILVMTGIRLVILLLEVLIHPSNISDTCLGPLLGALTGLLAFGLCYLISKGGMGAGDVKLMTVLGFFIGNGMMLPTMLIIVVCSALYSVAALLVKKVRIKSEIPFAPFVYIGTIVSLALGVGI